jgi:hypothetical protein
LLTRIIADAVIEGKSMRPPEMQQAEVGGAAPQTPAQILPGAAAQPKAEWEIELEAQEQAASASAENTAGQAASDVPERTTATGSSQTTPAAQDQAGGGDAPGGADRGQRPEQAATPGAPTEPVAGDEPGDASHPREADRQDAPIPAK